MHGLLLVGDTIINCAIYNSISVQTDRPIFKQSTFNSKMDLASKTNVEQIRRLLVDLERIGLWKPSSVTDQTTIEDTKDEMLRILNLIETELERAGLWDRSIAEEEKVSGPEAGHSIIHNVTIDQISSRAKEAIRCINIRKLGK